MSKNEHKPHRLALGPCPVCGYGISQLRHQDELHDGGVLYALTCCKCHQNWFLLDDENYKPDERPNLEVKP